MTLYTKIIQDLKEAMKRQDAQKVSVLRMLKAALMNAAIQSAKGQDKDSLADAETVSVLQKEAKKRKESAEAFKIGGREELAQKELAELELISTYLPKPLSEEELKEIVQKAIDKVGKNFGTVMGVVMKEVKGGADGRQVQKIVKDICK